MREHRFSLRLATAALAVTGLVSAMGCKTPPPTGAPAYGAATVAPPGTGMAGQPAPFGTYAAPPQAVSYPPAAGAPMPGPASSWQSAAPAAAPAAAPPTNTWSWSQAGSPQAQPVQQPSLQQYANQYTNQAQQFANQTQQSLTAQQQQMANQLQNAANQYQQGANNQMQQGMQNAQQQLNQQMQQATNQLQQSVPQMQGPQTQTVNGNWWPFSDANALPPARATPAAVPRY